MAGAFNSTLNVIADDVLNQGSYDVNSRAVLAYALASVVIDTKRNHCVCVTCNVCCVN